MKQLKRFVCVLIVLVMCAGTLPILALAEEEPDTAPVTEGDSVSDQPGEGEAEFLGEGDTDTPTEPADSEEPEEPDEAQPYSWYDAEAEEYVISSVEELKEFALLTRGNVTEGEDTIEMTDFAGKTVKLGADLDLGGMNWTGYAITKFAGVFDGQNHTVSNYALESVDNTGTALFADTAAGSVIKNLRVESVSIKAGHDFCAAVVGKALGKVNNCSVKDITVTSELDGAAKYIAGAFGAIAGEGSGAENCSAENVSISGAKLNLQQSGGLIGRLDTSKAVGCTASNVTVSTYRVYATGGVAGILSGSSLESCTSSHFEASGSGPASEVNAIERVGGLVGSSQVGTVSLKNCSAEFVSLKSEGTVSRSAGLLGFSVSNDEYLYLIENCSAKNVEIESASYMYSGSGLIGSIGNAVITDCTVENVDLVCGAAAYYCGGIIGRHVPSASAVLTVKGGSAADISITADGVIYECAGGIGVIAGKCDISGVTVTKVYIKSEGENNIEICGGFIGYVRNGDTAEFRFRHGDFTDITVSDVTLDSSAAITYSGGFTGAAESDNVFKNCTASGVVMKSPGGYGHANIGGFIGETDDGTNNYVVFESCGVTGLDMQLVGITGGVNKKGEADQDTNGLGGFIGDVANGSRFTDCHAQGSISFVTDTLPVGGFIGSYGWNVWTKIEAENCTADLDIRSTYVAGGFVGSSAPSNMARCITYPTIKNCKAYGSVVGDKVAGGFVGKGYRGTFENCEALTEVYGGVAGGFWGEIIPNPKTDVENDLTLTDCIAAPVVLGDETVSVFFGRVSTDGGD